MPNFRIYAYKTNIAAHSIIFLNFLNIDEWTVNSCLVAKLVKNALLVVIMKRVFLEGNLEEISTRFTTTTNYKSVLRNSDVMRKKQNVVSKVSETIKNIASLFEELKTKPSHHNIVYRTGELFGVIN